MAKHGTRCKPHVADFTFGTNQQCRALVSDNHLAQYFRFVKDVLLWEVITEHSVNILSGWMHLKGIGHIDSSFCTGKIKHLYLMTCSLFHQSRSQIFYVTPTIIFKNLIIFVAVKCSSICVIIKQSWFFFKIQLYKLIYKQSKYFCEMWHNQVELVEFLEYWFLDTFN